MTTEIEKQPEMDGKAFIPERVIADDCSGEHLACKVQWPTSSTQVCLWHVCQRNLEAKLTGFVGAQIATTIKLMAYSAAYVGVGSETTTVKSTVMDSMEKMYETLGSPEVGEAEYLRPDNIRAMLLADLTSTATSDGDDDDDSCDDDTFYGDSDQDESTVSDGPLRAWKYLYSRLFKSRSRAAMIFPAFSPYLRPDM